MATDSKQNKPASMTGFARVTSEIGPRTFEIVLRSVNHRFLDISFKIPREIQEFEGKLRSAAQARIERGRVDVLITVKEQKSNSTTSTVDRAAIQKAAEEYIEISKSLGVQAPDISTLVTQLYIRESSQNGTTSESVFTEADTNKFLEAFDQCIGVLLAEREKEGVGLIDEVKKALNDLSKNIESIAQHSEAAPQRYKEKLLNKLKSAQAELGLDQARLATECALQAERIDIAEEISRAKSHIKACLPLLEQGHQGKRLEFFAQELHREFTTLSGKSGDAEIQGLAVNSRVQVEKIREQAQNLE